MIVSGESGSYFGTSRKYLNSLSIFRLRPRFFFSGSLGGIGRLAAITTAISANWRRGSGCSSVDWAVACITGGLGRLFLRIFIFSFVRICEGGEILFAFSTSALLGQAGKRAIFFIFIGQILALTNLGFGSDVSLMLW